MISYFVLAYPRLYLSSIYEKYNITKFSRVYAHVLVLVRVHVRVHVYVCVLVDDFGTNKYT